MSSIEVQYAHIKTARWNPLFSIISIYQFLRSCLADSDHRTTGQLCKVIIGPRASCAKWPQDHRPAIQSDHRTIGQLCKVTIGPQASCAKWPWDHGPAVQNDHRTTGQPRQVAAVFIKHLSLLPDWITYLKKEFSISWILILRKKSYCFLPSVISFS